MRSHFEVQIYRNFPTLFCKSNAYDAQYVFLNGTTPMAMTNLSVNINKVATLRNSRGENMPDVVRFAIECEKLGVNGITVHPRRLTSATYAAATSYSFVRR